MTDNIRVAKRRRLGDAIDGEKALPYANKTPSISIEQCSPQSAIDEENQCEHRFQPASLSSYDIDDDGLGCGSKDDDISQVCYGMISAVPVRLNQVLTPLNEPTLTSNSIPVAFHAPNKLSTPVGSGLPSFEIACSIICQILGELNGLKTKTDITMQLFCYSKFDLPTRSSSKQNGRRGIKKSQSWFLNAILYGTSALQEAIGVFLSNKRVYLQDPVDCDRRVKYSNPHMIAPEEAVLIMTDSFASPLGSLEIERLEAGPDLLAQLMEDGNALQETEAPAIVLTALLPYRNNVNGSVQAEPPLGFQGGILADDMGLGKTLSMICLVSANQASELPPPIPPELHGRATCPLVKTTLIVVPPSLIQAWVKQFDSHIRPGALSMHVFHGQNRKEVESLGQYDVVITTFHTVSAIWRKENEGQDNTESIFFIMWHRIVLDEAHTIQNAQSQLAQACCALRSSRRWAITGTPIQNKLTDFASIVRFLQVYPYSDQSVFEHEISRPWHNGDPLGFLRLKTLVRAITISRTKTVVHLPPRIDEIHHLDFAPAEREQYDAAKRHTVTLLDNAISSGSQGGATFNFLQRLNILRLISSHGLLAQSNQAVRGIQHIRARASIWNNAEIQDSFCSELLVDYAACSQCGGDILEDYLEGSPSTGLDTQQQISEYGGMLCEQCKSEMTSVHLGQKTPHHRKYFGDSVSVSTSSAPSVSEDRITASIDFMSTKIKALIADILNHHLAEKCVVFSFWTYTLDLVQLMLNDCKIEYTRIDGKMQLTKRTEALQAFQKDDSLRVILVSITCGGAGLDLTAASRVYLLEPHWNPMIEEQALCRIHRVGQQRSVTTIRYLMRDSFEEQVVVIQERKRKLAQVTFGRDPSSKAGIGLEILQYLKSVLR